MKDHFHLSPSPKPSASGTRKDVFAYKV